MSFDSKISWFDLSGETALAWYFVMAHWPDEATTPILRFDEGPMRIGVFTTDAAIRILNVTLERSMRLGGNMAKSAVAVLQASSALLTPSSPETRPAIKSAV